MDASMPTPATHADADLWEAIMASSPQRVREALEAGASPDCPSVDGLRGSHRLAGHAESPEGWACLEILIRAGAAPSERSPINRDLIDELLLRIGNDWNGRAAPAAVQQLALAASSQGALIRSDQLRRAFDMARGRVAAGVESIEALCSGQGARAALRALGSKRAIELWGIAMSMRGPGDGGLDGSSPGERAASALLRGGASADALMPLLAGWPVDWAVAPLARAGADFNRPIALDGRVGAILAHVLEKELKPARLACAMALLRAGADPEGIPTPRKVKGDLVRRPMSVARDLAKAGSPAGGELLAQMESAAVKKASLRAGEGAKARGRIREEDPAPPSAPKRRL